MANFKNKAAFEDLTIQAGYLSNLAAVITTAMFDADLDARDCEEAMRFFTERLLDFSRHMRETLKEGALCH